MMAYVWVLWICAINDPSNCGLLVSDMKYEDINVCMVEMYKAKAERKGLNIVGSSCEIRDFPVERKI